LDGKTKQKATLYSGEYTLTFNGDAEGFKVEMPPTLVLRRGDKQIVKITRLPPGFIDQFKGHAGPVGSLVLTRDGKTLISAGNDGTIRLWNLGTGKAARILEGHSQGVGLALSPDGKTFASCSGDKTVKWWDVTSGKLLGTFEGHTGIVWSIVFAADGKSLF